MSLDKICGFGSKHNKKEEGEQPWLVGSITTLSKSVFTPIQDYLDSLKWRLKHSHYLKVNKKITGAVNSKIASFF